MSTTSSKIDLGLPSSPNIADRELKREFQYVYTALVTLQRELDKTNAAFAAYVATHP